ncbi:MAG: hypothetical protein JSV67_04505, partial [Thermoplasmatales archaeon]
MKSRIYMIFILIMLLFIKNAVSHVPITGGENNSLETAIEVMEPTKSWAIYDEIHEPGETKYYKFTMKQGEILRISLFVNKEEFTPGVIVMGKGLTSQGILPSGVEVPTGYGYLVFEGEKTNIREYEPFTPSSYYFTADIDINVTTNDLYYIAVFDELDHGKVGIAIGFIETFSVTEWLMIPINAINIHIWEGQNIALIIAPLYLTIIIGIIILIWISKKEHKLQLNNQAILGIFAAFLFIGSGLMILMQMIIALTGSSADISIIITLVFVLLPILFGILLMRTSIKIVKELNKR